MNPASRFPLPASRSNDALMHGLDQHATGGGAVFRGTRLYMYVCL